MNEHSFPTLADSTEEHADWLEFCAAFRNDDRFVAWKEHFRDLKIAGGDEAADAAPALDERIEVSIDDTVAELEQRVSDSGSEEVYPFEIDRHGVRFVSTQQGLSYLFQLTLSILGHLAAPGCPRGDQIFEELSAHALANYLGAPSPNVQQTVFGFPRRLLPENFPNAVQALTAQLGEGWGSCEAPEAQHQKDAFLDIVAWRDFPDGKLGKIIAFGQCATGRNWKDKYRDLVPPTWCRLWMNRTPAVDPVATFFLPRRVEPSYWRRTNFYGGIVFDRCRISHLSDSLSPELRQRLDEWIREATRGAQ